MDLTEAAQNAPMAAESTAAPPLAAISSMATRLVLAELAEDWAAQGGPPLHIESVGGVDAARRVAAGETFDLVMLASDAIDKLEAAGHVQPGSRTDLMRSGVAVAVAAGSAAPDIGTAAAVRAAVLAAPSIGLSTGPSGVALTRLFERWGIADRVAPRLVQAPAGVPVGSMIADGRIALGFQQLSELIHVPGIRILGPLPPEIQIDTVFSAAVCARSTRPVQARACIDFLASPRAAAAKTRQGMTAA